MVSGPKIREGYVYFYFCYDIAEEIRIEKLEKVLGNQPHKFVLSGKRLLPEYMQYRVPPLAADLGKASVHFDKQQVDADVSVKIYDFGAVAFRFQIPFKGTLEELKHFGAKAEKESIFELQSEEFLARLKKEINEFLVEPEKRIDTVETYTIFTIKHFTENITAEVLKAKYFPQIAGIVRQEEGTLSSEEMKDTVKDNFSYNTHDLTVVDWNGTLIYDIENSQDTLDIVEYAVVQLLELRTYDNYLDTVLERAYYDLEKSKRRWQPLRPYTSILDTLLYVRLEITEVIDKVENSLKLIGDPFLAKIYTIASNSFHLDRWQSSVRKKLNVLETTYTSLADSIQNSRMIILEVLIVLLFIVDIIMYLA